MVADASDTIKESIERIEKLDFIFSKGKLSMDLDGVEPTVNMRRKIVLKDARHPLMEKGIHFGSDDVCIKECSLKVGKHRHQRARRHKRIYNKMERARAKALIYNEMKNMEE